MTGPAANGPGATGPLPIEAPCPDEASTRTLAGRLAGCLQPGDVLLLEGDLGAGKTTFVQGLAAGLGVEAVVTSPTFTLMNIYNTTAGFDLVHVDVYRLERLSEVVDLALPEMIEDGSVVAVEWGDRAVRALPGPHLRVVIAPAPDDPETARMIRLEPEGQSWESRRPALAHSVAERG